MSDRKILQNCQISGFADEIDKSSDKQIEVLNRLGIHWIELRSADGTGIADMTIDQAGQLKEKLAANGIRVSAIGSPIGKIGIEDDFAPHLELLEYVMDLADLFETPYIRMFSFFIPGGKDPKDYRDEVMRRMGQMVERAAARKKVLLHENEKDIYGDTADRCLDLMKKFYGEAFKCTFDFANFVQCGQNTLEAYELLKPYVTYVHIKDAVMADGRVVPAGEGDGNLAVILGKLNESGYEGYLSLEPHLVDFSGLQNLEQNVEKRGRTDGPAAYEEAYQALMKLL